MCSRINKGVTGRARRGDVLRPAFCRWSLLGPGVRFPTRGGGGIRGVQKRSFRSASKSGTSGTKFVSAPHPTGESNARPQPLKTKDPSGTAPTSQPSRVGSLAGRSRSASPTGLRRMNKIGHRRAPAAPVGTRACPATIPGRAERPVLGNLRGGEETRRPAPAAGRAEAHDRGLLRAHAAGRPGSRTVRGLGTTARRRLRLPLPALPPL
jgi:hypothetical protein